jgi:transcription-repair coupling factor (superfamily II helicase)
VRHAWVDTGDELVDRFGKLPKQVENLLYLLNIKLVAGQLGVESINKEEDQIVIVNLSGRGDKDINIVAQALEIKL